MKKRKQITQLEIHLGFIVVTIIEVRISLSLNFTRN